MVVQSSLDDLESVCLSFMLQDGSYDWTISAMWAVETIHDLISKTSTNDLFSNSRLLGLKAYGPWPVRNAVLFFCSGVFCSWIPEQMLKH